MTRYLIEVSQPDGVAARRIAESVRSIGSHFATHARWNREGDDCIGTMVVEADDRWGALGIVPPAMRSAAQIFQLEAVGAR